MPDRHPPTSQEKKRLEAIALRIAEIRHAREMTQDKLARAWGVHIQRVKESEASFNGTSLTLLRLAKALGVEPSALLELPGEPIRPTK